MAILQTPNVVQNVGDIEIKFAHSKIYSGEIMYLGSFRLQGEFLSIEQLVDNSVLIPTLGGGSVQLTNGNWAGQISFNSIRTGIINPDNGFPAILDKDGFLVDSNTPSDGTVDICSIADCLRGIQGGDGYGGTFEIVSTFNGMKFIIRLKRCTLVRSPPFLAAGNDSPNYRTIFNYAYPEITGDPSSSRGSVSNALDNP
jgi:hypothetical protein